MTLSCNTCILFTKDLFELAIQILGNMYILSVQLKPIDQNPNIWPLCENFYNANAFYLFYIHVIPRFKNRMSVTHYRLNRLLKGSSIHPNSLNECDAFVLCCKMHKIVKQHELKLNPVFPIPTYDIAKRLEQGANELDGIRSCGPISAFIRIKATETLSIILCYLIFIK